MSLLTQLVLSSSLVFQGPAVLQEAEELHDSGQFLQAARLLAKHHEELLIEPGESLVWPFLEDNLRQYLATGGEEEYYQALIEEFSATRVAALALLVEANVESLSIRSLQHACEQYEGVASRFPRYTERYRAMIRIATTCTSNMNRADTLLRTVSQEDGVALWGAYARFVSAEMLAWRGERRAAQSVLRELMRRLDPAVRHPITAEVMIEEAKRYLFSLDGFILSPGWDRVNWHIRRVLGYEETFRSPPTPVSVRRFLDYAIIFGVRAGTSVGILCIAWLVSRRREKGRPAGGRQLVRWLFLMLSLWSVPFLFHTLALWQDDGMFWRHVFWYAPQVLVPGLMLMVFLHESVRSQIFSVGNDSKTADVSIVFIAALLLVYGFFAGTVASTVVGSLAAVGEEAFFRGALMDRFVLDVPMWLAIVLNASLFALVHVGPWWLVARVFVLGLLLCTLRWRFGGLLIPITVHLLDNVTL
jgi:membrane protease YdiL (CAAX protease family)